MLKTAALTALVASLVLVQAVQAEIINVPGDYLTIQEAIVVASDDDEVVVAPGTYPEKIDFLGKAITVRSSDGPGVTTIDGEGDGTVVTCTSLEGLDTVFEGFTVTNGNASNGGGMYIHSSGPTVNDCVFTANWASSGGVYISDGEPHFTGCVFSNNTGAGVYRHASYAMELVITGCEFTGNSGRAVYANSLSEVIISDCQFHDGHGIRIEGPSEVTNCSFVRNSVPSADRGGGIYNIGRLTLENCLFDQNEAGNGGGLYTVGSPATTVRECVFTDNSASGPWGLGYGGGLYMTGGNTSIEQCTFNGNSASRAGGGIGFDTGAGPTVTGCIFNVNTAGETGAGGGIDSGIGWDTIVIDSAFCDNQPHDLKGVMSLSGIDTCDTTPTTGACCLGHACIVATQESCTTAGGEYQGDGIECGEVICTDPSCLGDLDLDTNIGFSDLLIILSSWGPCPE